YRIDVLSDHSEVTTQAGQAIVDDRNRPITLQAGQKVRLFQDQRPQIDGDFDQDNFDFWVAERENVMMANAARRYVSPQMTGYQDLDANGDWRPEPEYGAVWYPRTVAADWAPYRFGRWAWVAPWGWTWIDQAPWGFAPFHYGRWVLIQNRWGWAPGRPAARPVYAPALVGWIGNPGWNVSFSFGSAPAVGWFPLAPREVYVPAYRHSTTYIRQINITHVHDVKIIDRAVRPGSREHFTYRDRQQAVTVVPANLLREGRPISSREIRRPERQELERAPQARQAPSADWLPPAASARQPRQTEGRDGSNGRPQRQGDTPLSRSMSTERAAPSETRQAVPAANNERRNEARRFEQPAADTPPDMRRENGRPGRESRQPSALPPSPASQTVAPVVRPAESAPPAAPVRQESASPRREIPSVTPQLAPAIQPLPGMPPNPARENRPERREPQGIERASPRENPPPVMPPREVAPSIPPGRVTPQPAMPQAMPPPAQPLREERRPPSVTPSPEREPRREMRELQREFQREMPREAPRQERSMPREIEAPAIRQREATPQAAPVMRAPQPQPAAPQPQVTPQPAREMPRQESRQEPRGGDRDNARRQDRGDEKGERGPR
ncbi:MAG TPA: DUF6600 domain-containing protein, partial [Azonexus sp.]|nr:DUF6600 domain-containing protein [Azonexus sp.]